MVLISPSTVLWLGRDLNSKKVFLQHSSGKVNLPSPFSGICGTQHPIFPPFFPMPLFYAVLETCIDFITPLKEGQLCSEDLSDTSFSQQWKRASWRAPTPTYGRKIQVVCFSAPSCTELKNWNTACINCSLYSSNYTVLPRSQLA